MSAGGTYALLLHLDTLQTVVVGALGARDFPPGWYLYVGSAQGRGGLVARLARHQRRADKRFHWHIDYLRAKMELVEMWVTPGKERQECAWAAAAAALPGAGIVASRLGASDCRCQSHLFHYSQRPEPGQFELLIQAKLEREQVERVFVVQDTGAQV